MSTERSFTGAAVIGVAIAVVLVVGDLLHSAFAVIAAGLANLPH